MLDSRDHRLATSGFVSTAELVAAGSADVAALAPVIRRTGDASTGALMKRCSAESGAMSGCNNIYQSYREVFPQTTLASC